MRAPLCRAVNTDSSNIILSYVLSINIVVRPKKEDSCDVFHFPLCGRLTLSPLKLFIAHNDKSKNV